jgi:hypothetical protein
MCHICHVSFDKKPMCLSCHGGYIKGKKERYIPYVSIYDYDDTYYYIFYIIVIIIKNYLKCVITEV